MMIIQIYTLRESEHSVRSTDKLKKAILGERVAYPGGGALVQSQI